MQVATKRRVLLIEDEAELRERLARMLEFEGYEVRAAADGYAGVSQAHDFAPEIVLCDLLLPQLDGFGVIDLLRRHLATEAVPIVVITALTERASQRRAMVGGADDYLTKPFSAAELLAAVESQFRRQAARLRHAG